jgi:hypothetical protein
MGGLEMPRSRIKCAECQKEITDIRKGNAVKFEGDYLLGKFQPWRIFLHPDCYRKSNERAGLIQPATVTENAESTQETEETKWTK